MYEKVFQLTSRPFVSTPDVERFYSAKAIHHALSQACSCIERASGTVLVVGPTGSGKTLFLQMLEEQFKSVYRVVNLACARLAKREDLLQNILFELNQPYLDMSEGELRLALIDYLRPDENCPNGILLLVDEAHLLDPALLDEVRLLTNFVRDGRPRAQLVLAGNVRLEENLMDTSLESFNQRVAIRCYLNNFTRSETAQFIRAAIVRAGADENLIFTEGALEAVHDVSEGCPRLINQVCDYAMILAAGANVPKIDKACIHEAWSDVQHLPNPYAAATSSSEQSHVTESEIEFGSLEDTETDCESSEWKDTEGATPVEMESDHGGDENLEPISEVPRDGVEEANWTEIEFGQLNEGETEELRSLSSYDDILNGTSEVAYELEQISDSVDGKVSDEGEQTSSQNDEEYRLAPPEPVQTTEISLEDFEAVNDLVAEETKDSSEEIRGEEYVDVRFKDLAQFLANGGKVGSSEESAEEELELAVQDQLEIQDELTESLEIDHRDSLTIESTLEKTEQVIDADFEELIQLDVQSEIRVFQGELANEEDLESEPVADESPKPDPFGEWFAEEEVVHDPYTALVAEQNNQSLNLTRMQLAILEDDYQEQVENEGVDVETADETDNVESEVKEEFVLEKLASELSSQDEFVTSETAGEDDVECHDDTLDDADSEAERADDLALEDALSSNQTVENSLEVDGSELLDTIHRQQAEIADQILQLKQDLADTGVVDVEPRHESNSVLSETPQDYLALETELQSVDNDDRDILVITRVPENEPSQPTDNAAFEPDSPVSTGRAIRMNYKDLFNQLRAAE